MSKPYDFKKIENKWRDFWKEKKFFEPDLKNAKNFFSFQKEIQG